MKPLDEYRADISKALNEHNEGWVCDGNYSEVRDLTLPQADTVVWLRLSYRVAFWRVLRRTVTRAWRREMLWGTNLRIMALVLLESGLTPSLPGKGLAPPPHARQCRP
jgi:adenylate kinase family enzyme